MCVLGLLQCSVCVTAVPWVFPHIFTQVLTDQPHDLPSVRLLNSLHCFCHFFN